MLKKTSWLVATAMAVAFGRRSARRLEADEAG